MGRVEFINKLPEVLAKTQTTAISITRIILEDLDKEAYNLAPALTNEMRNARQVVTPTGTVGHIIYPKIYSARLYFGVDFNFTKQTNPNAGPLWGQRAIQKNKKKWEKLGAQLSKAGMSKY